MGLLTKVLEKRDSSLSLKDYEQWLDLGLRSSTPAGVSVTPNRAMQHAAVFACVRILSETIASLPLIVYERLERGKRRADEHHLYELLKERPNEAMTAFDYREALQGHLALWGNAYSLIDYDGGGRVQELWPLRPDRMLQIVEAGGQRLYHYQLPSGEMRWLPDNSVWHLKGLSADGRQGYSPIQLMRGAVGLSIATEEFGARWFANDASPGFILSHPAALSPDAYERIRESWEKFHRGIDRKHRMAILEEGMKAEKVSIPPDDSQWIQSRKFQISEIARMFRIPLTLLEEHDKASTYASVEQFLLSFVKFTIQPWLVRWEQSIKHDLMLAADRRRYFPEHLIDALMRGDLASRYEAYAHAKQNGWMSTNDIRELENMNPVEGGDIYWAPVNMTPADKLAEYAGPVLKDSLSRATLAAPSSARAIGQSRAADQKTAARARLAAAKSYGRVFVDAAERAVRREQNDIGRAAAKYLRKGERVTFENWLRQYYEGVPKVLNDMWSPAFFSMSEAIQAMAAREVGSAVGMTPGLDECLRYHVDRSVARHVLLSTSLTLAALTSGDGSAESVVDGIEDWLERRPRAFASWETIRTSNLMAKATWFYAGAAGLEWVRLDENPFCETLDGMVIEVTDNCRGTHFVMQGEPILGLPRRSEREAAKELKPSWNVATPPLFEGCECQVSPVMPDELRPRPDSLRGAGGCPPERGRLED